MASPARSQGSLPPSTRSVQLLGDEPKLITPWSNVRGIKSKPMELQTGFEYRFSWILGLKWKNLDTGPPLLINTFIELGGSVDSPEQIESKLLHVVLVSGIGMVIRRFFVK